MPWRGFELKVHLRYGYTWATWKKLLKSLKLRGLGSDKKFVAVTPEVKVGCKFKADRKGGPLSNAILGKNCT